MSTSQHTTDSDLSPLFNDVQSRLKKQFGQAIYKSWLQSLQLKELSGGKVVLSAPTRFIREWVTANYAAAIKKVFVSIDPSIYALDVVVRSTTRADDSGKGKVIAKSDNVAVVDFKSPPEDEVLGSPLDKRFTFDNFVVDKSNELAFAAAKSIAEAKTSVATNNPLYIYGGVGLGKTHLMHAIAWHIRKKSPKRKVMYLSAEKFMYLFVRAIRNKDIMAFKEQLRSVDVLMIDDVQFICDKESTQEEFFHTFNALMDNNRSLIISSNRSPSDLDGMEERIRSRLGWGLVTDISATSYDLRTGILRSKVDQMTVDVPENVLTFLAGKIHSNTRELEGALNKVVAHSTLVGSEITLDATQHILADLLRANDRSITINDIQKTVARYFDITLTDMLSSRRTRSLARPRQIAMYLCKQLTPRSFPEIGRKFGGRDHTTVMHAAKNVEKLITSDSEFAETMEVITRLLQN